MAWNAWFTVSNRRVDEGEAVPIVAPDAASANPIEYRVEGIDRAATGHDHAAEWGVELPNGKPLFSETTAVYPMAGTGVRICAARIDRAFLGRTRLWVRLDGEMHRIDIDFVRR